jgi:MHS family citrate/tricarballylate:H+ symporter-like MFS transporter
MTDVAATSSPRSMPFRHVAAVVIGNGLEFYDFLSYSLFAVYIGKAFFPSTSATTSLLLSLGTFGLGFVTRPIGAIVLGTMGDRIGRKPAMLISFLMMGLGMLGVALTPTYKTIGIAAPILILCFRLVQGFALGGEVGPTTAYMIEAAPPHRRGLYGSFQYTSQDGAILIAALVGVVLSSTLSLPDLEAWGWRIAFLLGVAIVPFGIVLRSQLPETLHAADDALLAPDATVGSLSFRERTRPFLGLIVLGLLLLTAGTIGSYTTNYMTSYALNTLHFSPGVAFAVEVVSSAGAVLFEPLSGYCSDRFGRKLTMIIPMIFLVVSIIPGFALIGYYHTVIAFYAVVGWLSIVSAFASVPVIVTLTESLPRRIRSGALATIYAFAISIFGGSTQFVITWLIQATGSPMAPAWYWSGAAALGLLAMLLIPESAPGKLTRAASELAGGAPARA